MQSHVDPGSQKLPPFENGDEEIAEEKMSSENEQAIHIAEGWQNQSLDCLTGEHQEIGEEKQLTEDEEGVTNEEEETMQTELKMEEMVAVAEEQEQVQAELKTKASPPKQEENFKHRRTTIETFDAVAEEMEKILDAATAALVKGCGEMPIDEEHLKNIDVFLDVARQVPFLAETEEEDFGHVIDHRGKIEENKREGRAPAEVIGHYHMLLLLCSNLHRRVVGTRTALNHVHLQLMTLAGRSQADTGCGSSAYTINSVKRPYSRMSDDSGKDPDPNLRKDIEGGFGEKLMDLGRAARVEDQRPLETFSDKDHSNGTPSIIDFESLKPHHQEALVRYQNALQKCFCLATFGDIHETETSEGQTGSSKQTKSSKQKKAEQKAFQENLGKLEGCLTKLPEVAEPPEAELKNLWLPGPRAREVLLVQPFLGVLLRSLGTVLLQHEDGQKLAAKDSPPANDDSPGKLQILNNRPIARTKYRPKRIADKSIVTSNSRFIFLMRDDGVEICKEEKPGRRKSEGPEKLKDECVDQVISHLAKHVEIGFNFAGVGVDTRATGVVLTPAYVKILQLRLENMGRKEVKLVQLETKCLPLMSKDNFDKWCKNETEIWKHMREELYGVGDVSDANAALKVSGTNNTIGSVPDGLVALLKLMTSSRKDLFGSPVFLSETLGDLIGFGYFAAVYAHTKEENQVVKLSRYGATGMLEHEAEVLQDLKNGTKETTGVVRFISYGDQSVAVGGVRLNLKGLTLEPRGRSIEMHLTSLDNQEKRMERLKGFGSQLEKALEFVHGCGYLHNDISPKNMMVKDGEAFLIDFGIASKSDDYLLGFRGTAQYAHRSIFQQYPRKRWCSKAGYDYTGLAFSMAVLSAAKSTLWSSFQPFQSNEDAREREQSFVKWANARSETAKKYLKDANFEERWLKRCNDGGDEKTRL